MFNIENIGSFGIEYIDWDLGENVSKDISTHPEGIGNAYQLMKEVFQLDMHENFVIIFLPEFN